ncbi:MAG TPA: hypothetical protein VHQ65_01905 [Thermoanaerobaculia bacterium]|nr:hypothetical protein [Thermoanaerobaculia bacterium]
MSTGEPPKDRPGDEPARGSEPLYFFPDREVTAADLRAILEEGGEEQRAWAISHLLRYAQWDDIWSYVSRDEVREVFAELDLPENLRAAWGRMLKVEATVG